MNQDSTQSSINNSIDKLQEFLNKTSFDFSSMSDDTLGLMLYSCHFIIKNLEQHIISEDTNKHFDIIGMKLISSHLLTEYEKRFIVS